MDPLLDEFPSFFRTVKFNPGWEDNLRTLCTQLALIERSSGIATYATDLKDKFGVLRIDYATTAAPGVAGQAGPDDQVWLDIIEAVVENTQQRCR